MLVLGSGPIRIGQGIEFDYSCVHCVWALREQGYRAVIVNNNPETVSTDFDTGDALYFEPVTLEDVLDVVRHENPIGVVVQFGGQTAINLAGPLERAGVRVLGTSPDSISLAEDRDRFDQLLVNLGIPKPPGKAVRSLNEALVVAERVGYPVLVRPSFVLGGRAMETVYDAESLIEFYALAEEANPGQPVLVDKYFLGREAEVDAICDGETVLIPGIMEHIERAGVHSGDSMAVYPPVTLSPDLQAQMVRQTIDLARAMVVKGLMNCQFVVSQEDGHEVANVIEVNPRASRTVPYLSKVTGLPMVKLATDAMMGVSLVSRGYRSGLWSPAEKRVIPEEAYREPTPAPPIRSRIYAVKAPVFSFQKLTAVEPSLGPEMKSTGEILGIDFTYEAALYKALVAAGIRFSKDHFVLLTVNDEDKASAVAIGARLVAKGYRLAATAGTHRALTEAGIEAERVNKIAEGSPHLLDLILAGGVSLLINSPSGDPKAEQEAAKIRRGCIETGVPCVTSIDTARAVAQAIDVFEDPSLASCLPYTDYLRGA